MTNDKSNVSEKDKRKSSAKEAVAVEQRFSWSQIRIFVNEVKAEFAKIAWPSRKNTVGSAMLVVVLVTIMSLYLGAVDLFLGKLISYILK